MLKIIAIDKVRNESIKVCIDTFLGRMQNRLKINIIEINPVKYNTFNSLSMAVDAEAEKILTVIDKQDFIVALDENGKQYSSNDFSDFIFNSLNYKHISFIIGGSYGLSNKILGKADINLSLSKMTYTHEIARFILIEQLYRSYCIYSNIKYHH
jgi:23S rRNA (pseudouridine1915-N3)-methyltransferase